MATLDRKSMNSLSPKQVWKYFFEISQIPRESGDEKRIRDYIKQFAHKRDLIYQIDEAGNIIVKRPAAPGKEHTPGAVLQGHLDMVCVKEPDYDHDFSTDPIILLQDDDWITADRTTLGADNGIAVAMMLALLEEDASFGPLEALFTVSEETGLEGAFGLDISLVEGKYLINLDSEEEGVFYIGSAGGGEVIASLDKERELTDGNCLDWHAWLIDISKLSGGHSGGEIHLGKANAIKECIRFLAYLARKTDIRLSQIEGGTKRNVIPSNCRSVFLVPPEKNSLVEQLIDNFHQSFFDRYKDTDPEASITVQETDMPATVLPVNKSKDLINALFMTPHGIDRLSPTITGMVETSTNLASVRTMDQHIIIETSQRSALESAREEISLRVAACLAASGAEIKETNSYPAWTPDPNASLPNTASAVYKRVMKKEPLVTAIHAGLECGIITSKAPHMESISMGPTLRHVHSIKEAVCISSVERFYSFVKELLQSF